MIKKKLPVIALLSIIGVVLVVRACTIGGGKIEGQIVDNNGRPVEDALVLVAWVGHQAIFLVDSTSVCIHLDVAKTSKDGRYSIPAWSYGKINKIHSWIGDVGEITYVYKRGYHWKILNMRPYEGDNKERLQYLSHLSGIAFCGNVEERAKSFPWHRALYMEARDLAKTKEEKALAMNIRYWAVKAWIGESESMGSREIEGVINNAPKLKEALK